MSAPNDCIHGRPFSSCSICAGARGLPSHPPGCLCSDCTPHCSQCGKLFTAAACGPTHAAIAREKAGGPRALLQEELDFSGRTFDAAHDLERLDAQTRRVWGLMADREWRTLPEIGDELGIRSEASISARLRDFRKASFGSHQVDRRRRGETLAEWKDGLFEYRVIPNEHPDLRARP